MAKSVLVSGCHHLKGGTKPNKLPLLTSPKTELPRVELPTDEDNIFDEQDELLTSMIASGEKKRYPFILFGTM